ncbi:hypothetical protein BDY17DRAFT_322671 [Neohortaea acidophila]|uniref:Uncharacterized protein n=1 Tax=Neohortaea acidophila TaxID=245834 RepID=A0A6A6Q1J9_9PEZI|nr:uncharacterized protein BDY17DRAFT_322671 [Neohortaea acidophila]KAF2485864.1 hypothetical protein BDY17DRAFT_322671 [Neohortaea acidophila]
MKPFTTILLLTLGAATSTTANPASRCAAKNGAIQDAIDLFCTNTHIMVPSQWAHDGLQFGNAHVSIRGHCSPAQWVPQQYCVSQFQHLCAGTYGGFGFAHYGEGGCQEFRIVEA